MTRLVGVTGGIGAGKSSVLTCLNRLSHRTLDCDAIVHELYDAPSSVLRSRLRQRWGNTVIAPAGNVNRANIAQRVFANPKELQWLNRQIHPLVWRRIVETASQGGDKRPLFCAVPLLFEVKWTTRFDTVIAVWCDRETQRERLYDRGWSETEIKQRRSFQMDMDEKLQRADFGIINNSSWLVLNEQTKRIVNRLMTDILQQ